MIVKSILLKAGRSPESPSERIDVGAITVFVGPNNSGKSKVLAEIDRYTTNPLAFHSNFILENIEFNVTHDRASAEDELRELTTPNPSGQFIRDDMVFVKSKRGTLQIKREEFLQALCSPSSQTDMFSVWLSSYVLMLGGVNRISLVSQQPSGDFQQKPVTSLQRLFRDNLRRSEFRMIVQGALGFYPVVDPTYPGQLRLKISDRAPTSEIEERGWHDEAIAFHRRADRIEDASDGVKAFTGMILELIAGNPRLLLIDEPEAFLHPSLAFKLGNEIGKLALNEEKSVFVATHSASFLLGCLQSGTSLNIIRLTYSNRSAAARLLSSNSIVPLMRNPLLRSAGVMSALFYEFVVVTESDADRVFYSEINERLIRFNPEWGIPNCLFLNSHGKDSLHTIVKPLRDLGIPAACIVDIDVLKSRGTTWTRLLDSACVPQISQAPWGLIRSKIHDALLATGKDMKRDGGLRLLYGAQREAALNLFISMSEYGVFAIQDGELESWLKPLGSTGHGPSWLIQIFELMGEDPISASYVKPAGGDVWAFMKSVKGWLINPGRKGIPT